MDPKYDIVVGFSVNPELTWTDVPEFEAGQKSPATAHFHMSGTSFDVALGVKNCGLNPLLIGAVGKNDPVNANVRASLDNQGIDHVLLEARERTPWANVEPESDRRLSFKPPIVEIDKNLVREVIIPAKAQFQIVTGLMPDEKELELAEVLFTENGGIRILNPRKALLTADRDLFDGLVESVDWVFMNRIEAAAYLRRPPDQLMLDDLQRFLDIGLKLAVVTMDQDGAMMVSAESGRYSYSAYNHGPPVIDATGAGDCFLAFFVASIIKGRDAYEALRASTIASGIKVTRLGSSNIPTHEEVEEVLAE